MFVKQVQRVCKCVMLETNRVQIQEILRHTHAEMFVCVRMQKVFAVSHISTTPWVSVMKSLVRWMKIAAVKTLIMVT